MVTAVDSSVLLDVVVDNPRWADASEAALRSAIRQGGLIIGECVLAEISPAVGPARMEEFLDDWGIRVVASSRESALLAGRIFSRISRAGARAAASSRIFLSVPTHRSTPTVCWPGTAVTCVVVSTS